jgi:hypothetical protein
MPIANAPEQISVRVLRNPDTSRQALHSTHGPLGPGDRAVARHLPSRAR